MTLSSLIGNRSSADLFWLLFGFAGQIMFTMRFVTQWVASEKAKRSVIPLSFWIYSIMGSLVLTIYAIYRRDPVFILGQAPSVFIYIRNIMLMKKPAAAAQGEAGEPART